MNVLEKKKQLCLCCMEEHEIQTVSVRETNIFKGIEIEYDAVHFYCNRADEFFSDEEMTSRNDISMKNAYRKSNGLLTSNEIIAIRSKYGITQSDLCLLLGWGGKTLTRYESHQVQDNAHDTILRKLDTDPEWYITLLGNEKQTLGESSYERYLGIAAQLYEAEQDEYLKRAVLAKYAQYKDNDTLSGNTPLMLDKVIDVIRFFSNAKKVSSLYKVKLMKLLWYADALSFARRNRAITGLIYQALTMGAVPLAHELIIEFSAIRYEEDEFTEGTSYHFLPTKHNVYKNLSKEELGILEDVVNIFGPMSKTEIVNKMHGELAFIKTPQKEMISFDYTKNLSIR